MNRILCRLLGHRHGRIHAHMGERGLFFVRDCRRCGTHLHTTGKA